MHGLAHLAVAALAFPRADDLADDTYVGRVSVDQVDGAVREACRTLSERVAGTAEADPVSDAPQLEEVWRAWLRRPEATATKDGRAGEPPPPAASSARRCGSSPTRASWCRSGRTASTAPRRATRCRCASWPPHATFDELLALGVVAVAARGDARQPLRRGVESGATSSAGCACTPWDRRRAGYQDVVLDLRRRRRHRARRGPSRSTCSRRRDDPEGCRCAGRHPRRCCSSRTAAASRCCSSCVLGAAAGPPPGGGHHEHRGAREVRVGEDVAHVACEWMLAWRREPRRHREGVGVARARRRRRTRPGSPTPGTRSGPRPGSASTTCRTTDDRRRVHDGVFQGPDAPRRPGRAAAAELAWETAHREWTRHLVDVGLDPELFRYQRAMNAEEGEAAEAFSLSAATRRSSTSCCVPCSIPEEPQALADLVAGYAQKIASGPTSPPSATSSKARSNGWSRCRQAERAAGGRRAAEASAQRAAAGAGRRDRRAEGRRGRAPRRRRRARGVGARRRKPLRRRTSGDCGRSRRSCGGRSPSWRSPSRPSGGGRRDGRARTPRRRGWPRGRPSSRCSPTSWRRRRRSGCAGSSTPSRNAPGPRCAPGRRPRRRWPRGCGPGSSTPTRREGAARGGAAAEARAGAAHDRELAQAKEAAGHAAAAEAARSAGGPPVRGNRPRSPGSRHDGWTADGGAAGAWPDGGRGQRWGGWRPRRRWGGRRPRRHRGRSRARGGRRRAARRGPRRRAPGRGGPGGRLRPAAPCAGAAPWARPPPLRGDSGLAAGRRPGRTAGWTARGEVVERVAAEASAPGRRPRRGRGAHGLGRGALSAAPGPPGRRRRAIGGAPRRRRRPRGRGASRRRAPRGDRRPRRAGRRAAAGRAAGVEEIVPDTDARRWWSGWRPRSTPPNRSAPPCSPSRPATSGRCAPSAKADCCPSPPRSRTCCGCWRRRASPRTPAGATSRCWPPRRAPTVVERLPHLVGGVLLNNAADAARARAELAAARLLPCAVVAVGATPRSRPTASHPGSSSWCRPTRRWSTRTPPPRCGPSWPGATHARSADLERLTSGWASDRELLARVQGMAGPAPARSASWPMPPTRRLSVGRTPPPGPRPPTPRWPSWTHGPRHSKSTGRGWSPRPRTTRERAAELAGLTAETSRAGAPRGATAPAAERPSAARAEARAAVARAEGAPPARRPTRRGAGRTTTPGVAERARAELADLPLDSAFDNPLTPSWAALSTPPWAALRLRPGRPCRLRLGRPCRLRRL